MNAGGRPLETPFGKIYTSNITPDVETGIGSWSFTAFQRAMREGISKDGSHLYPAFPYTSFSKMSDEDLMSLYAFLMSEPAVKSVTPKTQLSFPFNIRPLMEFWNALFLDPPSMPIDPQQSAQWNRGSYLVNSLGHCTACHSPRNSFGAEKVGNYFLTGNIIDGWEAPALTHLNQSPIAWDETELYRYLRTGMTERHGMAGGPMAGVVTQLSTAQDEDIKAMAHYLASINQSPSLKTAKHASDVPIKQVLNSGQRIFESACGACHQAQSTSVSLSVEAGSNVPLQLNSQLHSDHPNNVIRTILEGIHAPATERVGYMPSFKNSLSNQQIADLTAYMREHFAPDKSPWINIESQVERLRQ